MIGDEYIIETQDAKLISMTVYDFVQRNFEHAIKCNVQADIACYISISVNLFMRGLAQLLRSLVKFSDVDLSIYQSTDALCFEFSAQSFDARGVDLACETLYLSGVKVHEKHKDSGITVLINANINNNALCIYTPYTNETYEKMLSLLISEYLALGKKTEASD